MNKEDQAEALCVQMLEDNPSVKKDVLAVLVEGILEGVFTYNPELQILTARQGNKVAFLKRVTGGFQKIK